MQKKDLTHPLRPYFIFALVITLIVISYLVIEPFIVSIISAFVLSYLIRPLFLRLNRKLSKQQSAIISVLAVALIILTPAAILIGGTTNQLYQFISDQKVQDLIEFSKQNSLLSSLEIQPIIEKGGSLIFSILQSGFSYVPNLLIRILVIMFGIYYMLIEWETLSKKLKQYLPFKEKEKVSKEISKLSNTIIYGTLLVAAIEFLAATIGFYISGVSAFFLLGSITFFLAFLPGIGPTVVWAPTALYYILTQQYYTGIGVIITGLILSFGIDTVVRAKILGDRSKINPFIMLVGILGGISLFGVFGFIVGPIVLIYTLKIIEELAKDNL